jgi:hypothetical protein
MNSTTDSDSAHTLEGALQHIEAEVDASLKGSAAATMSLRRLRAVLHDGNLREVRAALEAARQAVNALQEQVSTTVEGWDFDDAAYLRGGGYVRELLETAARMGLAIYEQDDRLYCYPLLLRVLSADRMLLVDRSRERRLRPSVVIQHLRNLQGRPPRFRPEAFLETLFKAYRTLVHNHGSARQDAGPVERLTRIYELLTLLPGQSREYSSHEFARDLYLLDRSGIVQTRDGYIVSFPSSTGTRSAGGVILAISESGEERRYWGIAFSRGE